MMLRLKPYLNVVQETEESCYVMASEKELFRCSGKSVPILVDRVFPLLDGTHNEVQIGYMLSDILNEQSVRDVLQLLMKNRIVENVEQEADLTPAELEAFAGVLTLFSRYSDASFELLSRVRRTHVAVVGDSALVTEVTASLQQSGIGTITVVTGADDLPLPHHPLTDLRRAGIDQLGAVVAKADLILGVQDNEFDQVDRLRELNRICLATDKAWLHVRITLDAEGWIGPLYQSGEACFECMEKRVNANLATWKEKSIYERQVIEGKLNTKSLHFEPFLRQLSGMAATEVVKLLTYLEPPALNSRTHMVDLLTQETTQHMVFKVPHCSACASASSLRVHPWDEDQVRIERMLL
jgi:bacteriocin biosynthesis cyclodehydratase domain-containing protein